MAQQRRVQLVTRTQCVSDVDGALEVVDPNKADLTAVQSFYGNTLAGVVDLVPVIDTFLRTIILIIVYRSLKSSTCPSLPLYIILSLFLPTPISARFSSPLI